MGGEPLHSYMLSYVSTAGGISPLSYIIAYKRALVYNNHQ